MPETLIAIEAGIDTRSASISAPKGSCANMVNWEKDQGAGMARRLGWCRYDGRVQGPEIEDGVVVLYDPANLTGTFQYGEQVSVSAPGFSKIRMFFIGKAAAYGTYNPALLFAYPVQTFTDWIDIESYPTLAQYQGEVSGALLNGSAFKPTLMNDSTITVDMYNNLKSAVQNAHAASVGAVPGRNESPIDAAFGFNDQSYAVHDCVIFTFENGNSSVTPLEGNCIRETDAPNDFLGIILDIKLTSGDWIAGNAKGSIVVYDYPLGQAFPLAAQHMDLYSADNTTMVATRFADFVSHTVVDAGNSRALLYSTYDQYVKTNSYTEYGQKIIAQPPYVAVSPPTWTRPRLTRELPYTCVGTPTTNPGFGPIGTAQYSTYEYTRLGLTPDLSLLDPITTPDTFPTVALDVSGAARWTNPNNILLQDGAVSTCVAINTSGFTTAFIRGTGFDFSAIPEGSTILGVEVRMRVQSSAANAFKDYDLNLVSASFPNGIGSLNKARHEYAPIALTDFVYGGSADLWDEPALTDFIVRDPSFGFQARWIRAPTGGGAQTVSVDAFAIMVTYVPPSRLLYVRDPTATVAEDIVIEVVHYCVNDGSFVAQTAEGVLTVWIGDTEAEGTAAGKIRRIGTGNEIRTAASTSGTNAPNGNLLAYVTAEDYPVSLPPSKALDAAGSAYEVIDANFWDTPDGRAAYFVNGAEHGCMFDGKYLVRIRTGRPTEGDNPRHVASHLGFLHLGFQSGAVVFTGNGHPLSVLGLGSAAAAGVYNFGEPITGMLTLNGSTLGVWTDRATRGLQGNSPQANAFGGSGYTPIMISPAINCVEYSLVNLVGEAVWCSYRGVETVRTVNAYGDFETLPLSAPAQGWLQGRLQVDLTIGSRPSRLVYSVGVRNKRQYRAYFADGFCFTLTMFDAGDLPVCTIQQLYRPNATETGFANSQPTNAGVVRHLYNGTRSDGKEVIFVTWENQNSTIVPPAGATGPTINGVSTGPYFPYVARIDCGYNDDIMWYMPNWIEFNAIWAGFPSQVQNWATATIYLNAYGGTQVKIYTKLDFDGPIFDYLTIKDALVPSDPLVQTRTYALPTTETKAYIPVPGRTINAAIDGDGLCLKLLIDGTQDQRNTDLPKPTPLLPLRLTHIAITTSPLDIKQN